MNPVSSPVGVGVIGCGAISGIYLQNLQRHDVLRLVARADLDMERADARERAEVLGCG